MTAKIIPIHKYDKFIIEKLVILSTSLNSKWIIAYPHGEISFERKEQSFSNFAVDYNKLKKFSLPVCNDVIFRGK